MKVLLNLGKNPNYSSLGKENTRVFYPFQSIDGWCCEFNSQWSQLYFCWFWNPSMSILYKTVRNVRYVLLIKNSNPCHQRLWLRWTVRSQGEATVHNWDLLNASCLKGTMVSASWRINASCVQKEQWSVCPKESMLHVFKRNNGLCALKNQCFMWPKEQCSVCPKETTLHVSKRNNALCALKNQCFICPKGKMLWMPWRINAS